MNCPHCNADNPDETRYCGGCGRSMAGTEPSFTGMRAVPDLIGKEIAGRYRVLAKLGEGGMGAVYKAEQISLKRQCAIKLLRPEVAGASIMLQRFNAEAQSVARLSHPNTVNIYDFGQDTDGTFFIAMEFVEGTSLRATITKEAPFSIRRALAIASQVGAALADAHTHSIVHRDLKPDNVMLQVRGRQKDVARVLDFGIAKLRDEGRATQQAMTQAGDMLGTPQYMAPEQIRGEQIDGRTDVYALGCMIYEMVTARMPFEGPTVMALLSKHLTEMPPPPSQRRPDLQIPPAIDQLVMTAMAKDPGARAPTMDAFCEQINGLLAQFPADTTQATAQVAAQAPVGTLATGPGFAPHTPPPGNFAPNTPPPSGYVTPGAMAPTPPPPGMPYQPPPQQPPYGAFAAPQPVAGPPITEPVAGGNSKLILIIIAVLVVIGGGIGVVFALKGGGGGDKPKDADAQTATADAQDKEPEKADAADNPPPKQPDAKVEKGDDDDNSGDDDDTPTKSGSDDPWANGGGNLDKVDDATMAKEIVTGLEEIKNQLCKCSDLQCVQTVNARSVKFGQVMAKYATRLQKLDPVTQQKLLGIQNEMAACMTRLANGATVKPKAKSLNDELEVFVNRGCACVDEQCAAKVATDVAAWVQRNESRKDGDEVKGKQQLTKLVACLRHAGLEVPDLPGL